jgi:hypothetical protein
LVHTPSSRLAWLVHHLRGRKPATTILSEKPLILSQPWHALSLLRLLPSPPLRIQIIIILSFPPSIQRFSIEYLQHSTLNITILTISLTRRRPCHRGRNRRGLIRNDPLLDNIQVMNPRGRLFYLLRRNSQCPKLKKRTRTGASSHCRNGIPPILLSPSMSKPSPLDMPRRRSEPILPSRPSARSPAVGPESLVAYTSSLQSCAPPPVSIALFFPLIISISPKVRSSVTSYEGLQRTDTGLIPVPFNHVKRGEIVMKTRSRPPVIASQHAIHI